MTTEKITLFIPTLNEIEGLKVIMPQIDMSWVDEIVVVDGGSVDGTREFMEGLDLTIHDQDEPRLCGAYKKCLQVATGDIIVAFSPDNNSIPELIPQLIDKAREGYDIVVASRYLDDATSEDDDAVTAFGNWMFTTMINVLFSAKYTDTLVMYRAFRKGVIEELKLDLRDPAWEPQMMIRAAKHKLKTCEIPGDEPARIGGVRKMNPLVNGTQVLKVILKEVFTRK